MRRILQWLLMILLGLGIFFRFTHLDGKVYWFDEVFTSLRASGYTEAEVVQHFRGSEVASITELQKYQHPDPNRTVIDTIQSLAAEDPQHPPLYYTLAHFWFRFVGSSVTLARALPALLSLLVFPSTYWLWQELFVETGVFTTALPTGIALALMAISPFHVLYAQESRQYSLWSVTTLLSTAALLRAIRRSDRISWGIYALTLTSNLYTFLLGGLVAIAHGIYVISLAQFRLSRTLIAYLQASLVSGLLVLPWIWVVIRQHEHAQTVLSWTYLYNLSKLELIKSWIKNIGRIFFDLNHLPDSYIHLALVVLSGYALYHLCRHTPKPVWLLIVLLIAVPFLPLGLPDLLLGGIRSFPSRYWIPSLLGIQLAVAYLLSYQLTKFASAQTWRRWGWQGLTATLIAGSILSCSIAAKAPLWWNKGHSRENLAVAQILNHAAHPVLVSDSSTGTLLSLSHLLKPTVQILIQPYCLTCQIPLAKDASALQNLPPFADIFFFNPMHFGSQAWLQKLESSPNYRLDPVVYSVDVDAKSKPTLWRVTRR